MEKEIISTKLAPSAIGPYSQGVKIGTMLFTSGQLPIDNNGVIPEGIKEQTRQCLNNIKAILESQGYSLNNVVKTLVFLDNMEEFSLMNEVYSEFFTDDYPARSTVEVARLPKDAKVEIEVVAIK